VAASLWLAISGSTVLNMVYDRDLDAKMQRTCCRPLPAGTVSVQEALALGITLAMAGTAWAVVLSPLYGLLVFMGLFFDVVVYTVWLKRRTPWAIFWGGVAGGMPVLAGRTIATGHIDLIGLLLALAVLLWIPTHVLIFMMKYAEQYERAGVPVFPNVYVERVTRIVLGISTVATVVMMLVAMSLIGLQTKHLHAMLGLGLVLTVSVSVATVWSTRRLYPALYKLGSVYMFGSMLLIIRGV